jgi:hypothetical protein
VASAGSESPDHAALFWRFWRASRARTALRAGPPGRGPPPNPSQPTAIQLIVGFVCAEKLVYIVIGETQGHKRCPHLAPFTDCTVRDQMATERRAGGRARECMPPDLSPKSSFDQLDYEQRLSAMEESRLQALHHSTGLSPPAAAAAAQRSRGRRLAHSLSDSLIVKGVRGRGWRSAGDAVLFTSGCQHSEPAAAAAAGAAGAGELGGDRPEDARARTRGLRGRLLRGGKGRRQQSSSTSRLPDPSSAPSAADDVVLPRRAATDFDENATRIQAAFRGYCCRQGADEQREGPLSTPRRASEDERAALYRDQIALYAPQALSPEIGPVSPIGFPTAAPCAPPVIELVECDDGAVRPSMGLSFAFVTSAEKLGLMLEPQSPDASARPTGEFIVENRRRSSSLSNCPAMELDFSAVRLIDDEVQRTLTQKHAPPPKKMTKAKRRSSVEVNAVSTPVRCLPRGTTSLSGASAGAGATAARAPAVDGADARPGSGASHVAVPLPAGAEAVGGAAPASETAGVARAGGGEESGAIPRVSDTRHMEQEML